MNFNLIILKHDKLYNGKKNRSIYNWVELVLNLLYLLIHLKFKKKIYLNTLIILNFLIHYILYIIRKLRKLNFHR